MDDETLVLLLRLLMPLLLNAAACREVIVSANLADMEQGSLSCMPLQQPVAYVCHRLRSGLDPARLLFDQVGCCKR